MFNWSELHLSEVTSYKIHTLGGQFLFPKMSWLHLVSIWFLQISLVWFSLRRIFKKIQKYLAHTFFLQVVKKFLHSCFTKLYFSCKNGSWNSNFESYLQYVWSTTPHTSGSENIQGLGERRPFDNYSHFFSLHYSKVYSKSDMYAKIKFFWPRLLCYYGQRN